MMKTKVFIINGANLPNVHPGLAAEAEIDSESDIYVISAGNLNLKFIFDGNKGIVTMPKSDLLITPLLENDMSFRGFTVQMPGNGMILSFWLPSTFPRICFRIYRSKWL